MTDPDRRSPPAGGRAPVVHPTRDDPVARWASESIGGPAGRRLGFPAHRWWTATRVLVLVAVVAVGLGLVQKNDCRDRGWTSPHQFVHACYSDLPVTYAVAGSTPAGVLGLGDVPEGVGQPPVSAAALAAVAGVTDGLVALTGDEAGRSRIFLDVSAVLLAGAAAAMAVGLVGLTRRRRWDAALVAGSPVLVLSGLVSIDLLGVALGVLALWMWGRSRPAAAGALLGLAVAARWHVALIALALVLVSLRVPRWREVRTTLLVAAVSWGVVSVPALLIAPQAWAAPIRAWWRADAGYGSVWIVPRLLAEEGVPGVGALTAGEVTALSLAATVAAVVVVVIWVLSATRTPRLPAVVLLLVVATLVVGKAVPVQAALWVLPWAALAVPRWRHHLWWWAVEAVYFVAVWQYLVGLSEPDRSLPAGYYAVTMLARLAVLAALAVTAWRWGWRWQEDPGRDPGQVAAPTRDDDPAAGPFGRPRTRESPVGAATAPVAVVSLESPVAG
ncbi:MAG: hypothetical protein ACFCVF_02130 [Kineosporiaceae bacterium]